MPFSAFDISMCPNKTCPHWSENPPCGRSLKNFEGVNIILSICSFKPEADGSCKHYMEPTDWKSQIEPWMLEQAARYTRDYKVDKAIKRQAKDANSLSADDLNKEV